MIERIFLDMDGVLADFTGAVCHLFERPKYEPLEYDFFEELAGSKEAFWRRVNDCPHFWENLPALPWMDNLLCMCRLQCKRMTVASIGHNHHALGGKHKWLEKHCRGLERSFMFGPDKYLLAGEGRVLIDDCTVQINAWIEAGGWGILFPQPWNTNRAFCGERVPFVKAALQEFNRRG